MKRRMISKYSTMKNFMERYKSPEIFEKEIKTIFQKDDWLFVGFEKLLKQEKGNYFSINYANTPIFFIRNTNRELKGFLNVCRHKGLKLFDYNNIEGKNSNKNDQIMCKFHGWCFNYDGGFIKENQSTNEETEKNNLIPIHFHIHHGMIFANLSNNFERKFTIGSEYLEILTKLNEFMERKDVEFVKMDSQKIKCNWKVIVENYQKGNYFSPKTDFSKFQFQKCNQEKLFKHFENSETLNVFKFPNLLINMSKHELCLNLVIPNNVVESQILSYQFSTKEKFSFFDSTLINKEELEIFQEFLEIGILNDRIINKEHKGDDSFFFDLCK
jgi:phenylpropionate dioxygenase-like ring-hydroxylating dioxygenase large terminal subunit